MQEYAPSGALPISLNAVGYDLSIVTAPNPNQVIRLELVMPVEAEQAPATSVEAEEDVGEPGVEGDIIFDITPTPAPTPLPSFKVGDLITIRTSPILDHNQNIVPDGTRVRFDFRISGEPDITQQFESTTQGGVAF